MLVGHFEPYYCMYVGYYNCTKGFNEFDTQRKL